MCLVTVRELTAPVKVFCLCWQGFELHMMEYPRYIDSVFVVSNVRSPIAACLMTKLSFISPPLYLANGNDPQSGWVI